MRYRQLMATIAVGLAVLAAPLPEADARQSDLEKTLGTIEWGDSHEAVIDKIKNSLLEKMRSEKSLQYDRIDMQQARERVLDTVEQIRESYDTIEAKAGGYHTSVISDELHRDGNDSLLRVKDPHAQRFFIFENDKLYKLVVAYSNEYLENISFKQFLVQTGRKYGRPDEIKYTQTVGGKRQLHKASWSSEMTRLKLQNYSDYFDTFVMVFSDRRHTPNESEAEEKKQKEAEQAKVSDTIRNLTVGSNIKASASGKQTADEDDKLMKDLFGDVNVTLDRGLDKTDDKKQKKVTDKSKESATKGKEAEAKAEKEAQPSKSKTSDPEKKKEGDLVIY